MSFLDQSCISDQGLAILTVFLLMMGAMLPAIWRQAPKEVVYSLPSNPSWSDRLRIVGWRVLYLATFTFYGVLAATITAFAVGGLLSLVFGVSSDC